MSIAVKKSLPLGAILLVAGCCIGAGMIGLPVMSASSGFLPSSVAMILSYLFTTATGLLLLESALWFDQKVNLLSIAQFALGKWGKWLVGLLFLFLFDAIFVAYLDAGGQLIQAALHNLFQISLPKSACMGIGALLVSLVIYRGVQTVDPLNRILILGLIGSYIALMVVGLPHVDLKNLTHTNWPLSLTTFPVLFICFGYQNLVPSLTFYLQKQVHTLRWVIILGNLIPLFFYLLWNFVILGLISPSSLGQNLIVTDLLSQSSPSVLYWVQAFSFFALFTSFITIALSFVDFLRDGFSRPPPEWILHALVLLPPLAICLSYPNLFLKALNFAGGFIDVLLFGIFPVLIVWAGRYLKKKEGPYQVPGGKWFLALMFLICMGLLLIRECL